MATYKSGDIVGTREGGYFENHTFSNPTWVPETLTWRLRYLETKKLWILTVKSSIPTAWDGKERIQSATDLGLYTLNPDFLASDWVKPGVLADNAALQRVGLNQSEPLGDNYIQDNSSTTDPTTLVKTNTTTDQQAPQGFQFNTTYLLMGGIVVVLALILAKRK